MRRSTFLSAAGLLLAAASPAMLAQTADAGTTTTTTTTVTNATGTISALNYGSDGEVSGLLVGTNILLDFSSGLCGGVGTLGAVGNSVTYSGTAITASSGFESVQVTSFTNNTTKATYTAPTSASGATAYGPTSGTIKQLNYGNGGTLNGFLFTDTGNSSPLFVSFGGTSASLTAVTTGATVSVTGTTSPSMAACSTAAKLEVVNASSLVIGSTTIVFGGGFGNGGRGGGPGYGGGH